MAIFSLVTGLAFLAAICCNGADPRSAQLASTITSHADETSAAGVALEARARILALPQLDVLASQLADHVVDTPLHSESNVTKTPIPANRLDNTPIPQLGSLSLDRTESAKRAVPSLEPFNLPATAAQQGDVSARWIDLQSRMLADEKTLASCRALDDSCPKAAQRLLSIVELGRNREGRARLGWINRAVNLSIRPMSDWAQYGYAQFWASPLQTLSSGAGDCKDYAIVKYAALRELGFVPDDLRLVIVRDDTRQAEHEVLAVHYGQKWLILDNLTMLILDAEQIRHYYPLFVMDFRGVRTFTAALARR